MEELFRRQLTLSLYEPAFIFVESFYEQTPNFVWSKNVAEWNR